MLTAKHSTKFLEIYINEHLNWKAQIGELAERMSSYSHLLRKNRAGVGASLAAEYVYVHSVQRYCVVFCGNSVKAERIFKLQRDV